MSEMEIEFTVKMIERFPFKTGYVTVFLAPCNVLEEEEMENPVRIRSNGSQMPAEAMKMIELEVKSVFGRHKKGSDYRDILLVIADLDFFELGWNYGDVIKGSFKKIKDGKDTTPFEGK
jgi:hypothetical protein